MLHSQSQVQSCRPSELIHCEDPTAAYILNRCVWVFGGFVESEVSRYQHATKKGSKKGEEKHPTEEQVREFRRAMIDQTPYSEKNVKKRQPKRKLSEIGAVSGGSTGGGRKIVQEPGKPLRVE